MTWRAAAEAVDRARTSPRPEPSARSRSVLGRSRKHGDREAIREGYKASVADARLRDDVAAGGRGRRSCASLTPSRAFVAGARSALGRSCEREVGAWSRATAR